MKQRVRRLVFRLLRKDPEAVIVSFWTGPAALAQKMIEEIHRLEPNRRHFTVTPTDLAPGGIWQLYSQLHRKFRKYRIGLAPVLFTREPNPLRWAAFLLAPRKILAYNERLERHHLRLRTLVASWLFVRGVPLDRIYLRPWWLCPWKRDHSIVPSEFQILDGRPLSPGRRRIAILSPYFPFPLSHGGAVRIFHLLRETAREFDVYLFAFQEGSDEPECQELLQFCAKLILVPKPRYREPRWSSLAPPEVCEYRSPTMRRLLQQFPCDVQQTEYTQLASYGGDVLVEHDVTFDLYRQMRQRNASLSAWWDYFRWWRFERRALSRYRAVIAMSERDARLLAPAKQVRVIENGVDLDRFRPEPELPGMRLLFVGSFRHFPNLAAYRFLTEEVWPLVCNRLPELTLTVVAGPKYELYWNEIPPDGRIRRLGFVRDIRPLYVEANLIVAPLVVSAGTNLKVLEAMAMQRAVLSTNCGCSGLGLEHGVNVWIADSAREFADGIERLITNLEERTRLAQAARMRAEAHFDWKSIGEKQRALYRGICDKVWVDTRGC